MFRFQCKLLEGEGYRLINIDKYVVGQQRKATAWVPAGVQLAWMMNQAGCWALGIKPIPREPGRSFQQQAAHLRRAGSAASCFPSSALMTPSASLSLQLPTAVRRRTSWLGSFLWPELLQLCVSTPKPLHVRPRSASEFSLMRIASVILTRGAGIAGGKYLERAKVYRPGSHSSHYTERDLFVGARLALAGRVFELLEADEFTYSFMEQNAHDFPNADFAAAVRQIKAGVAGAQGLHLGGAGWDGLV